MSITVHPFTESELAATDPVVMAAYNVPDSRKEVLSRYLKLQPDGAFVARHNDTIVGFGAMIDYGAFAYVGMMSVYPAMQKKGIGRLLLEQLLACLDTRGCATALLDATPAGAPLYARFGFVQDDTTLVLRQARRGALPRHLPAGVARFSEKDLRALVAFDAAYFGAQRAVVLASYIADNPGRSLVTLSAHGQITGFGIAQSHTFGPWVARSTEDAERLYLHALTLPFECPPSVFVSAHNGEALQLLTRYGFSLQRSLSHMRRGMPLQRSRHSALYGQTSLGFG